MHAGLLFLLVYGACVVAQRFEEATSAQDELLWRAQGARREFRLMDWAPLP